MHYEPKTISRKVFVRRAGQLVLLASVPTGLTMCGGAEFDRKLRFQTLDQALDELDTASRAPALEVPGNWNLFQVLSHLAQSIEFSVQGFPEEKSALFQGTVGSLAFSFFDSRGYMNHGLNDVIPGAPELNPEGNPERGFARIRSAIDLFRNTPENELRPHFAYGQLTKDQYERAHAYHVANHFSVIRYLDSTG